MTLKAMSSAYIEPNWPRPQNIQAWQTTREGGFSEQGYGAFNLASSVADNPQHVERNRQKLSDDLHLPSSPQWIRLVHGSGVIDAAKQQGLEEADGIYSNQQNTVLLIPTADCLPVLFCAKNGNEIAAAHAGWRGLSAGVLENTVEKFDCAKEDILVWFGPAIGPNHFEVGEEVRESFDKSHAGSDSCFQKTAQKNKYLANLYGLARLALKRVGVTNISGGKSCTVEDPRFFSYRKQGKCSGRMASLIWMQG
jgi:YfiH family protein